MDALPNAEAAAPVLPSVVRDGCPLGEEGLLQVSMLLHLYRVPRNDGEIAVTGLTAFKKGRSFGGYMS